EWTKIKEVVHFEDVEIKEASHTRFKARFSKGHRWLVEKASPWKYSGHPHKGGRKAGPATERVDRNEPADLMAFEDIPAQHKLLLAAEADTEHDLDLSTEEVEIIAWILTDGTLGPAKKASGEQVYDSRIYQKKPKFVAELDELLASVPHTRDEDCNGAGVTAWRLRRAYATDLIRRARLDEIGPEGFILALGTDEREAFLRVAQWAEGSASEGFRHIAQNDGPVKSAIALAAFLCGNAVREIKGGVRIRRPRVQRDRLNVSETGREAVWCVVTELGSWSMRQEGQVMLTGNSGLAYDITGSPEQMRRYFLTAWRDFHGSINELFYDPMGYYYDQGHKVPGEIGGHSDHVHIGFFPQGAHLARGVRGLGGARGGRGAAMGHPEVHLRGIPSRQGGVPGAAATAASQMHAAGLSRSLNKLIGGRGGGVGRMPGGGSVSAQIARGLFRGGLNKIGAAGIIGNAYAESSLNPAAQGYGGGGLWGFTASPNSLADLQAYAANQGAPWRSAALQTQFLLQHVSGGLIHQLNASRTPEAAAALFMSEWERPGIPRQAVREAGARKAFKQGFGRGGRVSHGFAGWFRDGGRGRVHGPTLLGLGENGPEDFEITPTPKRGRAGRSRSVAPVVHVNMGNVTIANGQDAARVGKQVGEAAARKLTEALRDSDDVREEELVNA
ncbi:MAG TPA: phage tail tip lysozyme, partial [Candidatus Acidoferrum sp.]|nr:phage tail tip lysozyme [Candidatus Acidoferrum sp.]